jgi:NAD(P)H-flavin reductase
LRNYDLLPVALENAPTGNQLAPDDDFAGVWSYLSKDPCANVRIVGDEELSDVAKLFHVEHPWGALYGKAGQCMNLRLNKESKVVPATFAGIGKKGPGTISFLLQNAGPRSAELIKLRQGDYLEVNAPIGQPTELEGVDSAVLMGGGYGCATSVCQAEALRAMNPDAKITIIIGARTYEFVYLENDARKIADEVMIYTDEGDYGTKGRVTDGLMKILDAGTQVDRIFQTGPVAMMKAVQDLAINKYNIPVDTSVNPPFECGGGYICDSCVIRARFYDPEEKTYGDWRTAFACQEGPSILGEVDFNYEHKLQTEPEGFRQVDAAHLEHRQLYPTKETQV